MMADKSYRFWNALARRYSNNALDDPAAYLEKLRVMREYLDHRARVLEFGCGTGSTALLLAPHARDYRAVDYSSRMIEIAAAKAAADNQPNLTFECSAFEDLALASSAHDVVIAMSVLHLMTGWREAIAHVYETLEVGGVFFSSTACLGDMTTRARHIASLRGFMGLLPRLSVFSKDDLEAELVAAGFKIFHQWQPAPESAVFIAAVKPPQVRGDKFSSAQPGRAAADAATTQ